MGGVILIITERDIGSNITSISIEMGVVGLILERERD